MAFTRPKQASAMVARPTPNFFSAARRVTDWAMLFVSSSNLWFISFRFFLVVCSFVASQNKSVWSIDLKPEILLRARDGIGERADCAGNVGEVARNDGRGLQ